MKNKKTKQITTVLLSFIICFIFVLYNYFKYLNNINNIFFPHVKNNESITIFFILFAILFVILESFFILFFKKISNYILFIIIPYFLSMTILLTPREMSIFLTQMHSLDLFGYSYFLKQIFLPVTLVYTIPLMVFLYLVYFIVSIVSKKYPSIE